MNDRPKRLSSKMSLQCPVCGKFVQRINRHCLAIHGSGFELKQANSIEEFIQLLQLIPVSNNEWKIILKHENTINRYVNEGVPMRKEVFNVLVKCFERYRKSPYPKLFLTNIEKNNERQ